jgi:hypothetical protein
MKGAGLVLALVLAGCSNAPPAQLAECRVGDFLGDWVSPAREQDGVAVGAGAVTVIAGSLRTPVPYVAKRDLGRVTRQVLRQEFANLAALGHLPPTPEDPSDAVCAIQLIRPQGAAALVATGRDLVLLEETGGADPPIAMRLRRGKPKPAVAPDLLTPPS